MPNIKTILKNSKLERIDTEILLSYLLKKDRTFLILNIDKNISERLYKKYLFLEKQRLDNWPIAYLVGFKHFYNYKFFINKNVLVPRPETEILIDISLNNLLNRDKKQTIIDIGTGSGAIIITLAKELIKKNKTLYNKTNFIALDISNKALEIAKLNSKLNRINKKISFYKSDLLSYLIDNKENYLNNNNDLFILANLPYLKPKELKEKSIKHEPKLALKAGIDGLKYYRKLFKQINLIIDKNSNQKIDIFCEINPEQKKPITDLNKQYLKHFKTIFYKDLSNNTRFSQTKNY